MSEQAALSHQEIANRAKRLIAAAAINTEPFPHIVIDEVFTETYYRQILQHLPPQTLLSIPHKFGMMKIGEDVPTFQSITETGRRFWSEFDRAVKPHICAALLQRYLPYAAEKLMLIFGEDAKRFDLSTLGLDEFRTLRGNCPMPDLRRSHGRPR
jgi:hypothetical protein